jgi:histidine triad (HIT) family protein
LLLVGVYGEGCPICQSQIVFVITSFALKVPLTIKREEGLIKTLKMSSIFTKIVNGEIPCYKITEDDNYLAFLDVNPNAKGHTLCIPKFEVDKIFDMDEAHYLGLMHFARKVALALEKAVPCKRVGMAVVGLEVPHAHVHLIPLNEMDEMRFQNKVSLSKDEFEVLVESIKAKL